MKYLRQNIVQPLLASMLLLVSLNALASDGQPEDDQCKSSLIPSKACVQYVKGYLAALQLLNQEKEASAFSAFEERAYRTRLGRNKPVHPVKNKLGVCLPRNITDKDIDNILTSGGDKQPAEAALVKAIRDKYPC